MDDNTDPRKPFAIYWDPAYPLDLRRPVIVRDTADGQRICTGDEIYVIAKGTLACLLARLYVRNVHHDQVGKRVVIRVGGPKTAVFFRKSEGASVVRISERDKPGEDREAWIMCEDDATSLVNACGDHDFSGQDTPFNWNGITRKIELAINWARRRGDTRPSVEIAEKHIRENYVTSQLPGPSPVYLNAARRAVGVSLSSAKVRMRQRHVMTAETVSLGINDDVATSGQTPNSSKHQEILDRLRARLEELRLTPLYDGYVDCIVELSEADVYFEVKSASEDSVVHQVRTGLGQVLHYIWIDTKTNPQVIQGHLIVEGPWSQRYEELKSFVEACSVRLTWSDEIASITASYLDPV